MFCLSEFCSLCLVSNQNYKNILSQDNDGIVIEEKLKAFLMEFVNFKPYIAKFVCKKCLETINYIYKFKIQCIENMTTLNEKLQKFESQGTSKKHETDHSTNKDDRQTSITEKEIQQNIIRDNAAQRKINKNATENQSFDNSVEEHEIKPPEEVFIKTEIEENLETNEDPLEHNLVVEPEHEHFLNNFHSPETEGSIAENKTSTNTKKRKVMKKAGNPEVEESLYTWFVQQRNNHIHVSSELLREKAKQFYEKITGKTDFLASTGWMDKFKQRHGIRFLKSDRLPCNGEAVSPFREQFMKIVTDMNLSAEQIYNADETAIFWRALPTRTMADDNIPCRILKDRLTFMPCCNSVGTHKLPLLVLGKSLKPRVFQNTTLPVIYKGVNKGLVTKSTFAEWYKDHYIPSVKMFLATSSRPQKALLIVDNAPSHLVPTEITDPNFPILLLPSAIQPMDQNLIRNMKLMYRKSLLNYAFGGHIAVDLKEFSLKNAVEHLHEAWCQITEVSVKKSWGQLLPTCDLPLSTIQEQISTNLEDDLKEITYIMKAVDPNLKDNEIYDWACGELECAAEISDNTDVSNNTIDSDSDTELPSTSNVT